jgi:6-phosphogluconolactonase
MGSFDLRQFNDPQALAATAAKSWVELVCEKDTGKPVSVALSGGRVAGLFLSQVCREVSDRGLSLKRLHFFWSDERCVPPTDSESNVRLANESMLIPLKIPTKQVHRIRGELPPAEACEQAELEVREIVPFSRGRPAGI